MGTHIRYQGKSIARLQNIDFERGMCLCFESWEGLGNFLKIDDNEEISMGDNPITMADFKDKFYRKGDAIYVCQDHEFKARGMVSQETLDEIRAERGPARIS